MEQILLVGGGGHCKSVIDVIEQEGKYEIAGIVDKKELIGKKVLGYSIIGCDDDLVVLFEKYRYAIVTVGQIQSNTIRVKLFNNLKKIGYKLPFIISPLAYVSSYANIEEGSIVMHHVLVNANAKIGYNCIINTKALIEHDVIIESHCHISTAAIINGGTKIKEGTFFGSNAVSREYVETHKNDFVKANSIYKGL